ncbi:Fumarylacetoacetate hydrolase family protein [Dissulfuribacter thermophilus]|uniref:Fumarylacetoacetate hydrolase family protein n=1 Tax=Dissulfuribacter thermophilus TaxID=1156395 RepID=A0A1B9F8J5_9BACT|nr:fumarylacetoacetate hydrolase family protein [Dissulfuribacter thermophilus]OCC16230.1 Fumarylacetoacetate hydrolase family protein [Dissulfuribacter thermophilus]
MKIVRFHIKENSTPKYGLHRGDYVRVIVADPFVGMIVGTSETYPLDEVTLLAPCVPSKIVCVGLNYRDHAKELGMELPEEPLIFLKPPSSVIGPYEEIVIPRQSQRVDHEAELAVVVGKRAKDVSPEEAMNYVLGFTCLNDVTARDLQKKDIQFTRSKSFDTFCPIGPWIETEFEPKNQGVRCRVNGQIKQDSTLSNLIHSPQSLLSFISSIMTLEPGDIIATGTPKGVSALKPGDEVTVEIEGIGELKNKVKEE